MIVGGMLGPWGGLEQVFFTSAEPWERPSRMRYATAISGRDHAQVLPRRARVWSCEIAHDAAQEGQVLDQVEAFSLGQGDPVTWYPADALGANMLSPEASLMNLRRWKGMTPGGARLIPMDHATVRFLSSGATDPDGRWAWLERIPVPHQVTLTVSAVVTAFQGMTADFWVNELDMTGATIKRHTASTTGILDRLSRTFETDGRTAGISLAFRRANTVATPQLTLTDHVVPWAAGRGCEAAVMEVTSRTPQWTGTEHHIYGTSDATSFTVRELMP